MNQVLLSGRIATDLILKYTDDNVAKVDFNLAVKREYTNRGGEYESDFIRCVVWRKQAEILHQYKTKGSWIEVYGKLQKRSYYKDNEIKSITEVIVTHVHFPPIKNTATQEYVPPVNDGKPKGSAVDKGNFNNVEDDLPF